MEFGQLQSQTARSLIRAMRSPSGWPVDPRERCDFYHRIRVFPPDVADWRKQHCRSVAQGTHSLSRLIPGRIQRERAREAR